jgi:hypothetical protein
VSLASTLTVKSYSPRWTWVIVWAVFIMIMAVGPINVVHASPPIATTIGVENISDNSVKLVGSVDPLGLEATVAFYNRAGHKWCDENVVIRDNLAAGARDVYCYVFNLQPSTVYDFKVVAFNTDGVGVGDYVTFTTNPSVMLATSFVSGIIPQMMTTETTDNQGGGVPGFPIESILAGILAGIGALVIFRRRKHGTS